MPSTRESSETDIDFSATSTATTGLKNAQNGLRKVWSDLVKTSDNILGSVSDSSETGSRVKDSSSLSSSNSDSPVSEKMSRNVSENVSEKMSENVSENVSPVNESNVDSFYQEHRIKDLREEYDESALGFSPSEPDADDIKESISAVRGLMVLPTVENETLAHAAKSPNMSESAGVSTILNPSYEDIRQAMNTYIESNVKKIEKMVLSTKPRLINTMEKKLSSIPELSSVASECLKVTNKGKKTDVELVLWPVYERFAESFLNQLPKVNRDEYFAKRQDIVSSSKKSGAYSQKLARPLNTTTTKVKDYVNQVMNVRSEDGINISESVVPPSLVNKYFQSSLTDNAL